MPDPLQFTALKKALQSRTIAVQNVANLARTIYKPGTDVKYKYGDGQIYSTEIGSVVNVERKGAEVIVTVTPPKGRKPKQVRVEDIIDFMPFSAEEA